MPPDVSVIVAVYNTMPYLTRCLESLVTQTIGPGRMEVIAVDDGSTDDSPAELASFASAHPDLFTIVRQENSGGPAAPSNRGLELATGRYVLFIGSDDYLGAEALARLVAVGDRDDADVVAGRIVGVNGRYVHSALYQRDATDVTFLNSALAWTLSNSKLFRRSLVETFGLRFPEDLPMGSDQPFTLVACLRARRISVLAEYTCYYGVRRDNASNISYATQAETRLACTRRIMDFVAGLVPPGPERDAILVRHFQWELAKLFRDDFEELPPERQELLCQGVSDLVNRYWTEGIEKAVPVAQRLRMRLAHTGSVDDLLAVIRREAAGPIPVLIEGPRVFIAYPGFRSLEGTLDERVFELLEENASARMGAAVTLRSVALQRSGRRHRMVVCNLELMIGGVGGESPQVTLFLADSAMPASADGPGARRLPAGQVRPPEVGRLVVTAERNRPATSVAATLPLSVDPRAEQGVQRVQGVRILVELVGSVYEIPLPMKDARMDDVVWRRGRPYELVVGPNLKGRLVIRTTPRSWRWALGHALRRPPPPSSTAQPDSP